METVREGKITVSPGVLLDIVQQAALYADGVIRMAPIPPRVDRIFRRLITAEGIQMELKASSIIIELYLVVRAVDMLALGQRVQKEVVRTMDKLVGLKVDAVNIHIEDVAYPNSETS